MFQNKAPCLGIVIVTREAWLLQRNRGMEFPTSFTAEAMTPQGKKTEAIILKMRNKITLFCLRMTGCSRRARSTLAGGAQKIDM